MSLAYHALYLEEEVAENLPQLVAGSYSLVVAADPSPVTSVGSYEAGIGKNRVVFAAVNLENGTTTDDQDITAFTLGGVPMELIAHQKSEPDNLTYLEGAWLFALKESDLDAGSQPVSISIANTGWKMTVQFFTYENVSQSLPTGPVVQSWQDNTVEINQPFTNTNANSSILSIGARTAASSAGFTPKTTNGTNVLIYDEVIGTGNGGFVSFGTYLNPGEVGTWQAGAVADVSAGNNPGGAIISVEIFQAPPDPLADFYDDFDRPDSPDIGNGWVETDPSIFAISNNTLLQVGGGSFGDSCAVAPVEADFQDGKVSTVFSFGATTNMFGICIARAFEDSGTNGFIALQNNTLGRLYLGKLTNGNISIFSSSDAGLLAPFTEYTLEFEVSGSNLSARTFLTSTGELLVTEQTTDSSYPDSGSSGVCINSSASEPATFYEFSAFNNDSPDAPIVPIVANHLRNQGIQ